MKRRSSWKDLFRDFASGGDNEPAFGSQVRRSLSVPHSSSNHSIGGEEMRDDAENDKHEHEDDDFGHQKEEYWPISARVRYANPPAVATSRTGSMLGHGQQLSTALEKVSSGTAETLEGEGLSRGKQPIGTRLTMTSRTGYFQDRIVAPSMVRSSSSAVASH